MISTLQNLPLNSNSLKPVAAYLIGLLLILGLSFAASAQEIRTALPTETAFCTGSSLTLTAIADHANKKSEVLWQVRQNGVWTNLTTNITTTFANVSGRMVTTTKLVVTSLENALEYRVAFDINRVDANTAPALTATKLVMPVAAFTLPAIDVYTGQATNLTFAGTASEQATYNWTLAPEASFVSGTNAQSKNPIVVFNTTGEQKITLTLKDGNCEVTSTQTLKIYGNYTWTGGISTDWFNAANWLSNAVPGAKDDVIIPAAPYMPELSANTTIRNLSHQGGQTNLLNNTLTINGNATVLGGTLTGGTIVLNQNLEVNSTSALTLNKAIFTGNATQTIKNTGAAALNFTNLIIDKTANPVLLENAINVNGTLDLKNSNKLQLKNADLTVGAAGQIVSGTQGYVVTNGTGTLQMTVANNNTEVFFPVGNHSYNPVKIKQTTAGTTDVFTVRVQGGLFDMYGTDNTGVEPAVEDGISRTWVITEMVKGGSVAQVNLQFSVSNAGNDWMPAFNLDKAVLAQYTESWATPKTGKPILDAQNNMMEVSQSNITSFRLFGVFNNDHLGMSTLPVELLSFQAARVNSQVELKWSTATEKNNDYFTLEQSQDGKKFSEVAQVKGAGNSSRKIDYSYLHKNSPTRLTYYRLKQTDYDGTVTYSKIVAVNAQPGNLAFSAYPNPSTGNYTLTGAETVVEAKIFDATGHLVKKLNAFDKTYSFDLSDQPAGLYVLHLNTGNEVKTLRLIKK